MKPADVAIDHCPDIINPLVEQAHPGPLAPVSDQVDARDHLVRKRRAIVIDQGESIEEIFRREAPVLQVPERHVEFPHLEVESGTRDIGDSDRGVIDVEIVLLNRAGIDEEKNIVRHLTIDEEIKSPSHGRCCFVDDPLVRGARAFQSVRRSFATQLHLRVEGSSER